MDSSKPVPLRERVLAIVVAQHSLAILERCLASLRFSRNVGCDVVVISSSEAADIQTAWDGAGDDDIASPSGTVSLLGKALSIEEALSMSSADLVTLVPYADYFAPDMLSRLSEALGFDDAVAVCSATKEITGGRFENSFLLPFDSTQSLEVSSAPLAVLWTASRLVGAKIFRRNNLTQALGACGGAGEQTPDTAVLTAAAFIAVASAKSIAVVPDRLYGHKLDKPTVKRARRATGGPGDLMRTIDVAVRAGAALGLESNVTQYYGVRSYEALMDELLKYGRRASIVSLLEYQDGPLLTSIAPVWTETTGYAEHSANWSPLLTRLRSNASAIRQLARLNPRHIKRVVKRMHRGPSGIHKAVAVDQLWRLQLYQLMVLKSTAKLCDRYSIPFFLAEGSLLGAVREGGCIEWDDDLDIAMMREDYQRFVSIPEDAWPEDVRLWWSGVDPTYHLPFAKVVSTKKVGFRNTFPRTIQPRFSGVRLDVFPIDSVVGEDLVAAEHRYGRIKSLRRSLVFGAGRKPAWGRLGDIVAWYRYKTTSHHELHEAVQLLASADNGIEGQPIYLTNWFSAYGPHKSIGSHEWYSETVMLPFDGTQQPVPIGYHEILSKLYGDYSTPPPVSQRYGGGHYLIYDPKWVDEPTPGLQDH